MVKTQKKRRASRASGEKKISRQQREAKHAISGYLVVWRHTMDDVPVGLYDSFLAATSVAKNMSFRAGYTAAKKLNIDCRTPVCFAVIEFKNGKAKEMLIVDREDDALRPISTSFAQRAIRNQRKKARAAATRAKPR